MCVKVVANDSASLSAKQTQQVVNLDFCPQAFDDGMAES